MSEVRVGYFTGTTKKKFMKIIFFYIKIFINYDISRYFILVETKKGEKSFPKHTKTGYLIVKILFGSVMIAKIISIISE